MDFSEQHHSSFSVSRNEPDRAFLTPPKVVYLRLEVLQLTKRDMAAETKMFVATKEINISLVMPLVIDAINEWQRGLLKQAAGEEGVANFLYHRNGLSKWSNGSSVHTHDFRSFKVVFKIDGVARTLFISHTCSTDYNDTKKGQKIIFLLGCYGRSTEIMNIVAKELHQFGRVFLDENDGKECGFVEIQQTPK